MLCFIVQPNNNRKKKKTRKNIVYADVGGKKTNV